MISGILGKKIGMTQIFKDGNCIPVTVVEVGPCVVLQVKKQETDGYNALQIGYSEKKEKNSTKAEIGHAKKHANTTPKRVIKEISWDGKDDIAAGKELTVEDIKNYKIVDVTGVSKGKGFQGTVKRHGFRGGPATHGQGDRLRAPGSIGQSANPSRCFKGLRMSGQMGNKKSTARNLHVVDIDEEKGWIAIKGGIPGPNGSNVLVKRSLTDK